MACKNNKKMTNNNFAPSAFLRLCVKSSRYNFIALVLLFLSYSVKLRVKLRETPWLILLLPLFIFFSCQSVPEIFNETLLEKRGVPLEKGASIYIFADVKEARPLIDLLPIKELKDSQTKQMLDKTDFLAAAMFPKESKLRFQLAAWGNYPSSGADMAFGMNKNWKKTRASLGYSYWRSEADKLSIAVSARQAFIAASADDTPAEPVTTAPAVKMPEGFAEFRKNASDNRAYPLSCWLSESGSVINRVLNSTGLPIRFPVQELFIVFFPADEGKHHALMRMKFDTASQAKSMAALLSVANNFIYGELGGKSLLTSVFFANPPVQSDRNIDVKTAPLGEKEIAAILGLLL